MEAFALYLFRSASWLTGFALVYFLFLKNERFFEHNRIFLISGILAALVFPLITITYKVIVPVVDSGQSESIVAAAVKNIPVSSGFSFRGVLIFLYFTGSLFVSLMIFNQSRSIIRAIRRSGILPCGPVKLIKSAEFDSAFSFFSYVFVNPSVTEIEIREIMNHEIVHIRQKHWLDLILASMLCVIQWFNPVIWIYLRLVRQNHEYIADKVALQRTSDPAIYRAALLNQIVGFPVISLANSFNYSVNKKRFNMMKNIISSPYRKMKILFILPVFAILLYAFAKPDYQYTQAVEDQGIINPASSGDKTVKGKVVSKDGNPLQGASVIVMGTTLGSTTDSKGSFSLEKVPQDAAIVVSYVGYKSKVIKSEFASGAEIKMDKDTILYSNTKSDVPPPPPPPPPPPGSSTGPEDLPGNLKIKNANGGPPPLVVLDGKITDLDVNAVDPESVESVAVLKGDYAVSKYGDKGRNDVIEITSKRKNPESDSKDTGSAAGQEPGKDMFVIIEELPEFPGGRGAMRGWIDQNLKYPKEASRNNITGTVYVDFLVSSNGKVKDVQVGKSLNPQLDAEAKRVVSSMPDWKPGSQNGKAVDVQMKVPVVFKLQ